MDLGNPQSCQLPTTTKYIVPSQKEGSASMKIEKLRAVWSTIVSCLIAEITPIGRAMINEKASAKPDSSSVTGVLLTSSPPTDLRLRKYWTKSPCPTPPILSPHCLKAPRNLEPKMVTFMPRSCSIFSLVSYWLYVDDSAENRADNL